MASRKRKVSSLVTDATKKSNRTASSGFGTLRLSAQRQQDKEGRAQKTSQLARLNDFLTDYGTDQGVVADDVLDAARQSPDTYHDLITQYNLTEDDANELNIPHARRNADGEVILSGTGVAESMENQDADSYSTAFDETDENDESSSLNILSNMFSRGGSGEAVGAGPLITGLEGSSRRSRSTERLDQSRRKAVDLSDTETPVPSIKDAKALQQDVYLEPNQAVRRAGSGPDKGTDLGLDPISRTTAPAKQANKDRAMVGEFNERMALEAERLGSPAGSALLTAANPDGDVIETPTVDLNIDTRGSAADNTVRSATPVGKVIRGTRESEGRSVRDSRIGRQSTTIGRRSAFLGDRRVTKDNLAEVQRQFQEDRNTNPDATDTSLHPNTIAFLQSRDSQLGGLVAGSTAGGTSAKGADAITRRTNTYRIGRPVGATFRDSEGNPIDRNRADTKVQPVEGSAALAMPSGEPDVLSGDFKLENPLQTTIDPLAKDSEGKYTYNPKAYGGADILTDEQKQIAREIQAKDIEKGRTPAQTGRMPSLATYPSGPFVNEPMGDTHVFSPEIHEAARATGRSPREYTEALQIDEANKTLGQSEGQGKGSGEAQNILRSRRGDISAVATRMIELPTVSQRQFDRKTGTYTRGTGRYSVSQPMGADLLSETTDDAGNVTGYGGVLAGVAAVDKPRASRMIEAMTVGTRRQTAPGELDQMRINAENRDKELDRQRPQPESQSRERLEAAKLAQDKITANTIALRDAQTSMTTGVNKEYDTIGFVRGYSALPGSSDSTGIHPTQDPQNPMYNKRMSFGGALKTNQIPMLQGYEGFTEQDAPKPIGSKLPWEESGQAFPGVKEALTPVNTSTPAQRQANIQRIDSVANNREIAAQTATRGRIARETFRRNNSNQRAASRAATGETSNTNLSGGQFSGGQERFIQGS